MRANDSSTDLHPLSQIGGPSHRPPPLRWSACRTTTKQRRQNINHIPKSINTMGGGGWFYVPKVCIIALFCLNGEKQGWSPCQREAVFFSQAFVSTTITNDAHTQVWSPAGGWWNYQPPNWQRNTGIAGAAVALCFMTLFTISSAREHRPIPPFRQIPSQSWSKHAAAEDPRLRK